MDRCVACSLPIDWHDDGRCPDYRTAARYLFGPHPSEPDDLRETHETTYVYGVREFRLNPPFARFATIRTHVNEHGRRVNELVDTFDNEQEAQQAAATYGMAQAPHR